MDINLFDFVLPENLIAQYPSDKRENARLLVINKEKETITDEHFYDITKYFSEGDVLVINDTKVIPVRLYGTKIPTGAKIETIILKQIEDNLYEVIIRNAKAIHIGTKIDFGGGKLIGECTAKLCDGVHHLRFSYEGNFLEVLDEVGSIPLPPYIKDEKEKYSRYQTVYAKNPGSAAAPTAGFHFTEDILSTLKKKGVKIVNITLNIGLATFRPLKVNNTKDHIMHEETYEISEETANVLNHALKNNARIISVGTTSTRALEANYLKYGEIRATKEATDLFITPGYKFNVVNRLITNFHLPKSTLIMLVSAFSNRELVLKAYSHAIKNNYRFFSFGDVMYIYGKD